MKFKLPDGCAYYKNGNELPSELVDSLEQMTYSLGVTYDSYLLNDPKRQYFWGPNNCGVIGFASMGRYVHVMGGLICEPEHEKFFLGVVKQFIDLNRLSMSIYSIDEDKVDLYRPDNFEITKFGDDFVIDAANYTCAGKPYEWVRRQNNFSLRHGVVFKEIKQQELSAERWSQLVKELNELEEELLKTKVQAKPTEAFQGNLTETNLGRRRLFVAFSDEQESRAEGFVVCNPYKNGQAYAVETYRYRVDAVKGVAAFLINQAIMTMRDEGIVDVSLTVMPGINTHEPIPGDSKLLRNFFDLWREHLNVLIDMSGIAHFKSRFRPIYKPVYVCVFPRVSVLSIFTFLMVWGVAKIKFTRVIVKIYEHFRKKTARKGLKSTVSAPVLAKTN